jgi:hypothetical protein
METILFGLNGLLLLSLWRYMLKKSVLDDHRDKLFDLRDELRATFASNGWDMSAPIYKRLRDLINGYLRFTETYSFAEFFLIERGVRRNARVNAELAQRIARDFKANDVQQQEFIRDFRRRAVTVMMSYMIMGSGPLFMATVLAFPVAAIVMLFLFLCSLVHAGGRTVVAKTDEFGGVVLALLRFTVAKVAKAFIIEEFVEEYAYRPA